MPDAEGDAARDRFAALLDRAAARPGAIPFWWRDDDAVAATPELERLLALARRHRLPLALAVIPKGATDGLAAALAGLPSVRVLQHGWRHRNHAGPGEKKIELGGHRPLADILEELRRGRARLAGLFPDTFAPILAPPWNRIAPPVSAARREVGLAGLSTFGPAPQGEAHWVNTHVDIVDWRARAPLARAAAYARLSAETERRLSGAAEPLGILTHHLVHQPASWDFLDELFGLVAAHPAARWPQAPELFALTPEA